MEHGPEAQELVGITLALALAAGVVTQSIARHLRIPGIVLLLAVGVGLGPDGLGWINPQSLGGGLQLLVGFAVAVILFEGGMNLDLGRLKREAKVIRRLLSLGALITAAGAAIYTCLLMDWELKWSVLFGTLMIVTGPTVVTPLLRRIKVRRNVETILEAEGVLIDAIGAVVAAATIQIVLEPPNFENFFRGMLEIGMHLGFGLLWGAVGGLLIASALRFRRVVPEGTENIFTLGLVVALFQLANSTLPESGIMAVTAAGIVVGNLRTPAQRDLLEFKEQLTVMLIGLLFVLLSADVRVADVVALGWPGVFTVASLMLVVRPLQIAICTRNSGLDWREKAFLAWVAPRGIVAAAVASLFAAELAARGIQRGTDLRALTFLVIGSTVLVQGLSGGLVARLLGLRRPVMRGFAIFGANDLGLAFGRILRDHGEDVLFLDRDSIAVTQVEKQGFRAVFGNALEERTLQRAQIDERAACLALIPNEEVNLLFTRHVNEWFKGPQVYVSLPGRETGVTRDMVREAGGRVLFGAPRDTSLWAMRLRRGFAAIEAWQLEEKEQITEDVGERELHTTPDERILPLLVERGGKLTPVYYGHALKRGDVVHLALFVEELVAAHKWLRERGWRPALGPAAPAAAKQPGAPADPLASGPPGVAPAQVGPAVARAASGRPPA